MYINFSSQTHVSLFKPEKGGSIHELMMMSIWLVFYRCMIKASSLDVNDVLLALKYLNKSFYLSHV